MTTEAKSGAEILSSFDGPANWDIEFMKAIQRAQCEAGGKDKLAYGLLLWAYHLYSDARNGGRRTPAEILASASAMMLEFKIEELQAFRKEAGERPDWDFNS